MSARGRKGAGAASTAPPATDPCPTCGHRAAARTSSRDARHALYRALTAMGAEQCPLCRDYVMLATHKCRTPAAEARIWARNRAASEATYRVEREERARAAAEESAARARATVAS